MKDLPEFLEDAGLPAELADTLPWARGKFIGLVTLAGCYFTSPGFVLHKQLSRQEQALGDFSRRRFAWETQNPYALPEPIPYHGSRLLWPVSDELTRRFETLYLAHKQKEEAHARSLAL